MIDFKPYLDKYGMVTVNGTPNLPFADNSENGLLFTVVAMESDQINDGIGYPFNFSALFEPCFINGKLYRSPEPHPKPESHDNYTACVLGSLIENNPSIPRRLLWSLIKHFGYVNKEFVGRFPQVWLLLFASSFPLLSFLLLPFLCILYFLQSPKSPLEDSSATQLQFVIVSIIDRLYPRLGLLKKWFTKLNKHVKMYEVMKVYYGENHPNTLIWKNSKV